MLPPAEARDGCDGMLMKANPASLSPAQQRFLREFAGCVQVEPAARRAGVHKATVYRWKKSSPAFVNAMAEAAEQYFAAHRAKRLAEEAERARWRERRNAELQPQRREAAAANFGHGWRGLLD